ncbi:hypothetical protein M433DRAFT_483250 [Acidomyces richmondensis BFW]|nr:hypothetical protein M433DRAFT_483250 [Acidomyces richmondensis BFW]
MRRLSTPSTSPSRPRRKSILSLQSPAKHYQQQPPIAYQTTPSASPYHCPLCHSIPSSDTPSLLLRTAHPQKICKPCYITKLQPRFLRALEDEGSWPVYLDDDDHDEEGRSKSRKRRRPSGALDPTLLPDFPAGFAERWRRKEWEYATPKGERVYCRHWVAAEGAEPRRGGEEVRVESAVISSDSEEETLSPPPHSRVRSTELSPRSLSNPAVSATTASPLYRPPTTRTRTSLTRSSIPDSLTHEGNLVPCGTFLSPVHAPPQIDTRTFVQKALGVSASGATRLVCGTCGGESCARCGMALKKGGWEHECVPGNLGRGAYSSTQKGRVSFGRGKEKVTKGGEGKTEGENSEGSNAMDRNERIAVPAARAALGRSMTAPVVTSENIPATTVMVGQRKKEEDDCEEYVWGWG